MTDIQKKIESQLDKAVSVALDDELANETAEQIKKRTRLGFGIDTNGKQIKLKPLSGSYRDQRSGNIAFYTNEFGVVIPYTPSEKPYLSPYTSPAKSNLTKSGLMIESISGKSSLGRMIIFLDGLRPDGYTNEEVKDFVENDGRSFFGLTNGEKNELARKIKDRILKSLN